jgi:DNA-directed RNA polymerase beta' subunit
MSSNSFINKKISRGHKRKSPVRKEEKKIVEIIKYKKPSRQKSFTDTNTFSNEPKINSEYEDLSYRSSGLGTRNNGLNNKVSIQENIKPILEINSSVLSENVVVRDYDEEREQKTDSKQKSNTSIRSLSNLNLGSENQTNGGNDQDKIKNERSIFDNIEKKREDVSVPIENIYFNFFTEEEIKKLSVAEISETRLYGPNSLYDLRMGPLNNSDICETCEEGYDCPGHFGHIELAVKIPHPLRSKNILEYLSIFCKDCHRLVILDKKIKLLGFHRFKGDVRYKKILNEIELNVSVCPYCESMLPIYNCVDDKYSMQIKGVKYPLRYQDIYEIFSNIRESDVKLLGFDDVNVHPIRLLIGSLLVVPPCVRPFITSDDGENSHDDLTYKYIDIIKTNNKIREEKVEKTKIDEIDKLMFHIKTLMDNNKGKARDQNGKRPIKCIKKRISSKQGRIRLNIQGKRAEFCARTVIGADAMCMVDELIMPPEMAKNLSYPVRVNKLNIDYCKKLLDEDKVNYIRRDGNLLSTKIILWSQGFKLKSGDKVIRNGKISDPETVELIKGKPFEIIPGDKVIRTIKVSNQSLNNSKDASFKNNPLGSENIKSSNEKSSFENKTIVIDNVYDKLPKRKNFEIKEGDILERQLKDGDLCVFNRQPTLWKGSMRAKRIKILPGKTFRFNLASTQAFNADYDGDEMNAWISHSEHSRAECATILNTVDNFMSSKDSKPLLAIKQDAMTGGYKLTYGYVAIPKHTFMDCLVLDKKGEFLNWDMEYITNKINHIIKVYKWTGEWDNVKSKLINDINDTIKKLEYKIEGSTDKDFINQLNDEIDNFKSIDIDEYTHDYILYNGHSLFSFLLPDDFEYTCQNKLSPDGKPVFITRGVLMSGTLSKAAIGSSSGSLIHHIGKDYGYQAACDFLSFYQILINSWLLHYGHTIGLRDCIPTNTDTIEAEINKCYLEASAVMRTEKDEEILEAKVAGKLNKAVTVGQKLAKEALDPINNLVQVIKSGAKGDFLNITQVTGTVGQQNVSGERIPKTYYGRTLPHYVSYGKLDVLPSEILDNENIDPLPYMKKLFESRGFVSHSYFQGLSPQEFFFHAAGGREGLIDTACKTATTGYIQRKMIKMMEDLRFNYTNNVTNANDSIVEFMYGEDNMDPSKLIQTEKGFSFIDIKHISDKLNNDIEWSNIQK